MRRWLGASLVVLSAAGCGSTSADQRALPSPSDRVIIADNAVEGVALSINGTVAQRIDATFGGFAGFQNHFSDCFAAHGEEYPVAPFDHPLIGVDGPAVETSSASALPTTGEAARGAEFRVSEHTAIAWRNQREVGTPVVRSPSWERVASVCFGEGTTAPSPTDTAASLSQALDDELSALSKNSGADRELTRTYVPCLKAAGFTSESRDELIGAVRSSFSPFGLVGGPPVGGDQWRSAVAFESAAANADATCRKPAHALFATGAPATVSDFTTKHRSDIAAAARSWATLSAQARTLKTEFFAKHKTIKPY